MNRAVIEARGLWKTYQMDKNVAVHAVRGLDLTVREGELVAIVGASGSGKSSLLHILGFMDRPTRGELLFEGRSLTDLKESEMTAARATEIGFLFQTFNLMPALTVLENVMLPMRLGPVPKAQWRTRAVSLLQRVGLAARASHLPRALSGGERQRVALARALANKPKLLLADEPTGQLDSVTSDAIVQLFQQLNEEGQTIVVVTHNPEVAARAKAIYRMKDGLLQAIAGDLLLAR